MFNRYFLIALAICSIIIFAFLIFPQSPFKSSAQIQASKCWFNVPVKYIAYCGQYLAGKTGVQSSTDIVIPVVYLKRRFANWFSPNVNPTIYIQGGPGYAVGVESEKIKVWFGWMDRSKWPTDLLLYDQRGVGLSSPAIRCGETSSALYNDTPKNGSSVSDYNAWKSYVKNCAKTLADSGVNLNEYSTGRNFEDIVGIMKSINDGDHKWNVMSTSYGTKIAQLLLENQGSRLSSVIMDSISPVQKNYIMEVPYLYNNLLENVTKNCNKNIECSENYPGLENSLLKVLKNLKTNPVDLDISDEGKKYSVLIDDKMFVNYLFDMSRKKALVGIIPIMIDSASRGHFRFLEILIKENDYLGKNQYDDENLPVFLSVSCSDHARVSKSKYRQAVNGYSIVERYVSDINRKYVCNYWPVKNKEKFHSNKFKQADAAPVNVLLLAGRYDVTTPVLWAREYAQSYRNSFLYVFPAEGHGLLRNNECAQELSREFVLDPKVKPGSRCLEKQDELKYFK